jgi:molybdenum cofactor cytidylyltransferase
MQLVVLILAAGKSSRMGNIKQLLKIEDKTLIENAIETSMKIEKTSTLCVLGAHAAEIKKKVDMSNVDVTINKDYELGLSSSIISGIKHLQKQKKQFDGIFLLLADQPAIKVAYYQEMVALFSKEKKKIIASKYKNGFGVPAIFPKSFIKNLLAIKGDKGAREFLQKNKKEILSPKTPVNLVDIDSPKDYKTYLNTL